MFRLIKNTARQAKLQALLTGRQKYIFLGNIVNELLKSATFFPRYFFTMVIAYLKRRIKIGAVTLLRQIIDVIFMS